MTSLSLTHSTHGIENGSLVTSFSPTNQTLSYLNCTSIECFGKSIIRLHLIDINNRRISLSENEKLFSILLFYKDMYVCGYTEY